MSKKILLIESDPAFAQEMATAIEARGLQARITGDGREGLELAKADRPDAVVLCVELPRMSGYSVCQKFKKDNRLREIPLVLMSAEATQDTFEQHRKLKARADEYLLKPFDAAALLQVIGSLVQLPSAAEPDASEDVVTLDDVEELDAAAEVPDAAVDLRSELAHSPGDEDEDLRLLDEAFDHLASAPDAPVTDEPLADSAAPAAESTAEYGQRDELAEADAALAAVAAPVEDGGGRGLAQGDGALAEADAALAAISAPVEDGGGSDLAEADAALAEVDAPAEAGDRDKLAEADAALAALGADEVAQPEPEAPVDAPPGVAIDLPIAAAEAAEVIVPPLGPDGTFADAPAELQAVQDRVSELHIQLARTEEELQHALLELSEAHASAESAAREHARRGQDADARATQAEEAARAARDEAARAGAAAAEDAKARAEADERARSAEARAGTAEAHAQAAAERTLAAEQRASTADDRAAEADRKAAELAGRLAETERALAQRTSEMDDARGRADALAPELEAARAELATVRAQAERARTEAEQREGQLKSRVAELEALNARHEERVVKAYQKIKGDEKMREKTRKALAIALQLLEERTPGAAPPDVQPRRE